MGTARMTAVSCILGGVRVTIQTQHPTADLNAMVDKIIESLKNSGDSNWICPDAAGGKS